MVDDDLDLDLDLDSEPAPPKKPSRPVKKAAPPAASAPGDQEQAADKTPAEGSERKPSVVPARKQNFLARWLTSAGDAIGNCWRTFWSLKNLGIGVLLLLLLILFVENWPAMRLSLFGLFLDVPKAVVLVVDFLLGFGVAWLLIRRRSNAPSEGEE